MESDTDATNCYLFSQCLALKVDLINTSAAHAHSLLDALNGSVIELLADVCEVCCKRLGGRVLIHLSNPRRGVAYPTSPRCVNVSLRSFGGATLNRLSILGGSTRRWRPWRNELICLSTYLTERSLERQSVSATSRSSFRFALLLEVTLMA